MGAGPGDDDEEDHDEVSPLKETVRAAPMTQMSNMKDKGKSHVRTPGHKPACKPTPFLFRETPRLSI